MQFIQHIPPVHLASQQKSKTSFYAQSNPVDPLEKKIIKILKNEAGHHDEKIKEKLVDVITCLYMHLDEKGQGELWNNIRDYNLEMRLTK